MPRKKNWLSGISIIVITLFSLFCILPILLVLIVSMTKEEAIRQDGYSFWPKMWSLKAYSHIFSPNVHANGYLANSIVLNSYAISIIVTLVGTGLAVLITGMAGYTLANSYVRYRNQLALYFFITMIFSSGVVPWYLVCKNLGLTDNLAALIIPNLLFSPFNLFLVRNFMRGIPDALMESARIDGANDFTIAFRIYFPLAKPVMATIALFYGIAYWNDWWNTIMLVDNNKLYPLQYMLFKIQSDIRALELLQEMGISSNQSVLPSESLKMATAIITVGPIVLLYPLLQRYFIKGLVIGSIKG